MADFGAVIRKTIGSLKDPTPEAREKVYEKARAAVERQLAAMSPVPPEHVVARQRERIEAAIAEVEADYVGPAAVPDDFPDIDFQAPVVAAAIAAQKPDPGPRPTASFDPQPEQAAASPVSVRPQPAPAQMGDLAVRPKPRPAGDNVFAAPARPNGRLRTIGGIAAIILVLGAAAAAGWFLKDDLVALVAGKGTPEQGQTGEPTDTAGANDADTPTPDTGSGPQKFTQRLSEDGSEVDPGPAGGEDNGEGTTVAEVTPGTAGTSGGEIAAPAETTPNAPAGQTEPDGAAPDEGTAPDGEPEAGAEAPAATETASPAEASVPVGQRAIFYEERTGQEAGTSEAGSVVWSVSQESPGGDAQPEPAIRADVTIPQNGIGMSITIRRNADKTLPASHIIELAFTVPDGFPGRAVDQVQRMTLKGTEQEPGNPLQGVAAKIDDNFFLIALNDVESAVSANTQLLSREKWMDIPMAYSTGRRALVTLEKGLPGEKVFSEVLKAWEDKPLGG